MDSGDRGSPADRPSMESGTSTARAITVGDEAAGAGCDDTW
jgi:hypothetical protein